MGKSSLNKSKKGFSLIEVIVAVAILSAGIAAVIQALSFCVKSAGLAADITSALLLSQDKFQEIEFRERRGLLSEGSIRETSGKFTIDSLLSKENIDEPLYRFEVAVLWDKANRNEKISFASLFLK